MKVIVVILAVFFIITVEKGYSYSNRIWTVLKSNRQELILSIKPKLNKIDSVLSNSGDILLIPNIEQSYISANNPGSPIIINTVEHFTIPSPTGFSVESVTIGHIKSFPGTIAPKPILHHLPDSIDSYNYIKDNQIYSEYSSPDWIKVDYEGIARNRYIASVKAVAARWNASTKSIEIPDEITIKIKFDEGNIKNNTSTNFSTDDFRTTLNHDETKQWIIPSENPQPKGSINKYETILSSNNFCVLISISSEGVYQIDNSMLSNLGINLTKDEVNTISIYGNGGAQLSETVPPDGSNQIAEQPIIVNTNSDGTLNNIIFFASAANGFSYSNSQFNHWINHYSNTNYYILTWGGSAGLRQIPSENPGGTVMNYPTIYHHKIYYQEELNSPFNNNSGRIWFGRTTFPSTFTQQLYDLVRTDTILYKTSVAQYTPIQYPKDGTFNITENDNNLMNFQVGSPSENEITAKLPASNIASDNRSVLKYTYSNPAGSSSIPYFNWFEIQYPRVFVPINNEISFFSDAPSTGLTEYSITGFSGAKSYGYDVTDLKSPKLLINIASTADKFVFRTNLIKNSPGHFFISSSIKYPVIQKVNFANLRASTDGADLVVITHKSLIASAQKFADYRSKASNIKVKVITTDDIFTEFSSGLPDPTAIRNFLTYTYYNWNPKPKYVLLWGHGHFDYKNITSQAPNYVLPYESNDSYYPNNSVDSYTTDDYFVRCVGNDKSIDMGIGRMPVYSPETGDWMVEKIKKYENGSSTDSWRSTVTLIADDSWTSDGWDGPAYTNATETLSYKLPVDFKQKKIYLAEYPTVFLPGGRRKPGVNEEMLSTINTSGNLIVSWIGHGNPRVWAHEEILDRDVTIPQMKNLDKLFFTTAATCDFAHYDAPDIRSGAEVMLLSQVGGSIGLFAADRSVIEGSNEKIDYNFYNKLLTRDPVTGKYPTLGDVMFAIKQVINDETNDVKFNLLGDPSMRLLIPELIVSLDSINGNYVTETDTVHLSALSRVNLSARIINPVTMLADSSFNGTATITMLDCDDPIVIIDPGDGTQYDINRFGSPLNNSSYNVENGTFNASFLIPKDISFSSGLGRLFAFAFDSTNNRFAKGASRSYDINGIDTATAFDTEGPEINIFLDSRDFIEGDYVSNTPLLLLDLKDKSGINTTGRGIGHRIEMWLDDNPNSIDLTAKYTNSLKDPLSGTVQEFLYSLSPGEHFIKVRAWDVFNNYTISRTSFYIADSNSNVVIENVYNYPNPFTDDTRFLIKHNATPPVNAELKIYNEYGALVASVNDIFNTLHVSEIHWNGFCLNGQSLSQGAYTYRLFLQSYTGQTGSKSGMILHIK